MHRASLQNGMPGAREDDMEWKEMLNGKTLSREKLLAYGFHEREGRLWLERGLSHGFTAVFCADTDVLQAEIRDEEQTCRHAEQIISACVLQDNREKLLAYAHARYGTSAEYLRGEASFLWRAAQC